jgi:hypothetical protein
MATFATVQIEVTITMGPHKVAEAQKKVGDRFEADGQGERYCYSYSMPHTKGILSGTLYCYDNTLIPGEQCMLPIQAQIERTEIKLKKGEAIFVKKPEKSDKPKG